MDTQQSVQAENSVPTPPVQKDHWFKILLIIVGFLIALGLFGNIYLLLRKENQKPISEITPPNPNCSFAYSHSRPNRELGDL